MFVPLNLGSSHWTLLALDSKLRSRCAVFWDPLVYRCPKEIWSGLTKFFTGFILADLQSRVQYDGFQCGVWVCWAVMLTTSFPDGSNRGVTLCVFYFFSLLVLSVVLLDF